MPPNLLAHQAGTRPADVDTNIKFNHFMVVVITTHTTIYGTHTWHTKSVK